MLSKLEISKHIEQASRARRFAITVPHRLRHKLSAKLADVGVETVEEIDIAVAFALAFERPDALTPDAPTPDKPRDELTPEQKAASVKILDHLNTLAGEGTNVFVCRMWPHDRKALAREMALAGIVTDAAISSHLHHLNNSNS